MPTSYRRAVTLGGSVCVIAWFTIRMMRASAPSSGAPPTPPPPIPAGASEAALRRHYGLVARPRFEAFEVSDGVGRMSITLPAEPQIEAQIITDRGARTFVTAATVRDGGRVISGGVIAFADDGPFDGMEVAETLARASETQLHGAIERDEVATLAGLPARVVEIALPEHRRLLSWYVADAANACGYQIACVDRDTDDLRHACTAIAQSLTIAPLR
ncbi:MAG: hypothetical protein K8W52_40470 [Deltaproteobacteria bacterium]|nr:hypothetical protein [Deltaproteobacteria bacterium]